MGMGTLDFNTITTGNLYSSCCIAKLRYKYFQLFLCYFSRCFLCIIWTNITWSNQSWCTRKRECHIGRMEQLSQNLTVILMYRINQFLPSFNEGIIIDTDISWQICINRFNCCNFCDNQANTALCTVCIMFYQCICDISFIG